MELGQERRISKNMPQLAFSLWAKLVADRVREHYPTAQVTRRDEVIAIRVAERSATLEDRDGAFWVRFMRDDRKPTLPATHDIAGHDELTAGVAATNIIAHLHVVETLGKAGWAGTT